MKKIRYVFGAMAFVGVLVVILATVPVLRYNVFRTFTELPGIFVRFNVTYHISGARNFETASWYIARQIDLSEAISPFRSQLFPSILSNISYVIGEARFPKDFHA